MDFLSFVVIIAFMLVHSLKVSVAVDTIAHSQFISDGMTLVSPGGTFEHGFFSPGNSKNRYLGIWYKNIPVQTVVWVANSLNPINDSSGTLTMNITGSLVLSQNGTVVWYSTIISQKQPQNPAAKLLDSGNFVVWGEKDANQEDYLWQSFDYPSDTMLPGMKLGWNLRKGLNWTLTAWKTPSDPAPGDCSFVTAMNSYPETYLMKRAEKFYRFGPMNGLRSSGTPRLTSNSFYAYNFVHNEDEFYYTYYLTNNSVVSRLVLNQTDYTIYRYVWVEAEQSWKVYLSQHTDYCDNYGLCGANGNCVITETPICQCLEGFSPKSPQVWNSMGWSQGCVPSKPLSCKDKLTDGFVKMVGLKVPDTTHTCTDDDDAIGLEGCKAKCLNNCSCNAYTNSDISGKGSGCVMWFGDLIDIRKMAASELGSYSSFPSY